MAAIDLNVVDKGAASQPAATYAPGAAETRLTAHFLQWVEMRYSGSVGIIVGFLPFLMFAILSKPLGATVALVAGAVVSAVIVMRGRLTGASPKILEIGTLVLFAALAGFTLTFGRALSIIGVRFCVDCGLLVVVLISMAVRSPFTVQYAREQVPRQYWNSPTFMHVNYVVTGAWAVAFVIMVIADATLLFVPELPQTVGFIAIVAALLGAVTFTRWYPKVAGRPHRAG